MTGRAWFRFLRCVIDAERENDRRLCLPLMWCLRICLILLKEVTGVTPHNINKKVLCGGPRGGETPGEARWCVISRSEGIDYPTRV